MNQLRIAVTATLLVALIGMLVTHASGRDDPVAPPTQPATRAFHLEPFTLDWQPAAKEITGHLAVVHSTAGQDGAPATQPAKIEFESYQLVILRSGDNAGKISKDELTQIQKQHLAYLRKMGDSGKMVIAGPFGDQQDKTFRGMCLYRVGSIDEARKLAEDDPAVKAGRMKVEVMTWYVEKGYMTFPKAAVSETGGLR